ncbi:MAG: flagellar basal body rod protein FlgB, partial [Nitrospirota bacterium]
MMIFGKTIGILENLLDLRSKRHNLILSNIANQDTPRYKARDLSFADELTAKIKAPGEGLMVTSPGHIGVDSDVYNEKGKVITETTKAIGIDQNSVNVDQEMANLAENSIMYN